MLLKVLCTPVKYPDLMNYGRYVHILTAVYVGALVIFLLKVKWKPHEMAFPEISLSSLEVTTSSKTPNKGNHTTFFNMRIIMLN